MANLTIVNVDDEYPALQLVKQYCEQLEEVELLASFQKPEEALAFLKANKVDLVVFDINMPGMNGVELLQQLPDPPLCIFLTLETKYAVKAFELDVVHYLLKHLKKQSIKPGILFSLKAQPAASSRKTLLCSNPIM